MLSSALDLKLHARLHTWCTSLCLQVHPRGKKPIYRDFLEPSDGLEPSTPPYHGGSGAVLAGTRALATTFLLQIGS